MSYGFDAYLSAWQWRMIFVMDVLVKSLLIYMSAAVATLGLIVMSGFEPLVPIVLVAFSISSLHFLCIYLAIRFIARYKLSHISANFARFALLLVFANVVFVATLAAALSVNGSIPGSAILGVLVAATNLLPFLPVALIAGISRLGMRSR